MKEGDHLQWLHMVIGTEHACARAGDTAKRGRTVAPFALRPSKAA
jgi:hypothetical protein